MTTVGRLLFPGDVASLTGCDHMVSVNLLLFLSETIWTLPFTSEVTSRNPS